MTGPDLELGDRGESLVVSIRGDLDMTNAVGLRTAIEAAILARHRRAVVDLTDVDYLDSAGVHLLFRLGRHLDERAQRLLLVVPDGSVAASTLHHAHATAAFPTSASVAAALEGTET